MADDSEPAEGARGEGVNHNDWFRVIPSRGFPLAITSLPSEAWCHQECYQRWASRPIDSQAVLGGHIHFDEETGYWSVPFPVPLRDVGLISYAGVRR